MMRQLKMLGAALAAVLAMGAMASAAQGAEFTAEEYPVFVSASGGGDQIEAFGSVVECANSEFNGSASEASESLTITPTYTNCTGPLGLPLTLDFKSCDYRINVGEPKGEGIYAGTMDIVCAIEGDAIHKSVYFDGAHTSLACTITVPEQSGIEGLSLTDNGNGTIGVSGALTGIEAEMHNASGLCPAEDGATTNEAEYRINGSVTVSGENEAEEPVGVGID